MTVKEIIKARKDWLETPEGQSIVKTDGFCDAKMQPYLENRVLRAFSAGIDAAEKAILDRLHLVHP